MTYPHDGSHMVFLVGCPRSGTTWLQRLLASHEQVHSGPETSLFINYIGPSLRSFSRRVNNLRPSGLGCYLTREEYLHLLQDHLQAVLSRLTLDVPNGDWWLEKTPGHALWLPEIHEMLPQAKVIHILRDGRDTVASLLAAHEGWGSYWAPRGARRAAKVWVDSVQAARAAQRAMPAEQWMEVRYEALLTDPLPVLRQCAAFLGLPWDETALACAVDKNSAARRRTPHPNLTSAATADQEETPLMLRGEVARQQGHAGQALQEPAGFVRNAQAGSWKRDLSPWHKWQVHHYAGDLLRECGYE